MIIASIQKRELDTHDETASVQLKRMANKRFIGQLAGLCDIYCLCGKLSQYVQQVNIFLWERIEFVKVCIEKLEEMARTIN